MKLKQVATYWSTGRRNGYGQIAYNPPKLVACRWEDGQALFVDGSGDEVISRAKVYLDFNPMREAYLMLGESDSRDPLALSAAFQIRAVDTTPNLKNTKQEIKAWL